MKFHTPILTLVEQAAQEGLIEGAEAILELSNEYAPKDTEAMIKTGRVSVEDLTVQVSYSSPIAPIQHDNLDYEHDDGGPKFLERAGMEVDVEQIMAARMRSRLGG